MAQRHLEQTTKDSHFKARNQDEDRLAIGAPSKGKATGQGLDNTKIKSERGDCGRNVLGQGAKVLSGSHTGYLSTTSWKLKVVGQQEQQGDQRDGEEGEEVNGEVESIRETHNEMTHGTCA